jgi:hypothetical protein
MNVENKEYLREIAATIKKCLPDNHGFVLLTARLGNAERRFTYTSNILHEDAINLLREYLIVSGYKERPLKPIS